MSRRKFDTGSVGKMKFGMGALIGAGIILFAVAYYSPSATQIAIGVGLGALSFFLRRVLLGEKRFQRRWPSRPFGFFALLAAALLIAYLGLREFVPELRALTTAGNAVWIALAVGVAFCLESVAGIIFYVREEH